MYIAVSTQACVSRTTAPLAPCTRPALHRSHTRQRQNAETVKFHVIRIFTKPDADRRARAVPRAQSYELLSGPFRGLHLTTHCAVAFETNPGRQSVIAGASGVLIMRPIHRTDLRQNDSPPFWGKPRAEPPCTRSVAPYATARIFRENPRPKSAMQQPSASEPPPAPVPEV
jgi:hypothetical protein